MPLHSHSQNELYAKYKEEFGEEVALVVAKWIKTDRASFTEVEVIRKLIAPYKTITVHGTGPSGKGLCLKGCYSEGNQRFNDYYLHFVLQYTVPNPSQSPHAKNYSVDMVVEVFHVDGVNEDDLPLGALGIEYDGHPGHFDSENIRLTYLRDANISSQAGIQQLRISPAGAKKHLEVYEIAIKKFIRRTIGTHLETVRRAVKKERFILKQRESNRRQPLSSTLTLVRPIADRWVDCPICKGMGFFCSIACLLCGAHGRVRESLVADEDLSAYYAVTCPACNGASKSCRFCAGSGTMDNIKALEYAKKHDCD
ncbi:hypothetical protein C5E04_21580 [Pectobacterium parmentieri]|uniref:hypothetical protein n=1 Tax=Pectobacterium parmentieri TaxID=1905730 RepID=UPI000EB3F392|nr:hypothetical protein [Pectobacterium parmentieri]RKO74880.1 hypothetical protein C5E04_21580 [Pectobacterium parmentieri]